MSTQTRDEETGDDAAMDDTAVDDAAGELFEGDPIDIFVQLLREHQKATDARIGELTDALNDAVLGGDLATAGEAGETPRPWAERATPDQWHELADWVDWAQCTYPTKRVIDAVPGCWPLHPGAVEELAGLWAAWRSAMVKDAAAVGEDASGDDAAAYFHDRYLWTGLERVRERLMSKCRAEHVEPAEEDRAPATDRTSLPEVVDADASGEDDAAEDDVDGELDEDDSAS